MLRLQTCTTKPGLSSDGNHDPGDAASLTQSREDHHIRLSHYCFHGLITWSTQCLPDLKNVKVGALFPAPVILAEDQSLIPGSHGDLQSSTVFVSGDLMPFSDLPKHQVSTWYTVMSLALQFMSVCVTKGPDVGDAPASKHVPLHPAEDQPEVLTLVQQVLY